MIDFRSPSFKLAIQCALLLAAVSSLILLAAGSELQWPVLEDFRWEFAGLLIVIHGVCNLVLAESLRINLGQSSLSFRQAHAMTLIRAYYNLAFPVAGTGYSAYLLREHFKVSLPRFGTASLEWTAHQFLAAASLGLAVLQFIDIENETNKLLITVVLAAACAGSFGWIIVSRFLHHRLEHWAEDIQDWRQGLTAWRTARSLILQFALTILRGLRLWAACLLVGLAVNPGEATLLSVSGDMGSLVNLTPNGIGVREALATASAGLIALPIESILVATLLERLMTTSVNLLMGLWYSTRFRFVRRHGE